MHIYIYTYIYIYTATCVLNVYTLYTQVRVSKTGISQYGWLIIEQSNSNGYESKPLCS